MHHLGVHCYFQKGFLKVTPTKSALLTVYTRCSPSFFFNIYSVSHLKTLHTLKSNPYCSENKIFIIFNLREKKCIFNDFGKVLSEKGQFIIVKERRSELKTRIDVGIPPYCNTDRHMGQIELGHLRTKSLACSSGPRLAVTEPYPTWEVSVGARNASSPSHGKCIREAKIDLECWSQFLSWILTHKGLLFTNYCLNYDKNESINSSKKYVGNTLLLWLPFNSAGQ